MRGAPSGARGPEREQGAARRATIGKRGKPMVYQGGLTFPSWLLAERPADRFVGLDHVDNALQFGLLDRALRTVLELVSPL